MSAYYSGTKVQPIIIYAMIRSGSPVETTNNFYGQLVVATYNHGVMNEVQYSSAIDTDGYAKHLQ